LSVCFVSRSIRDRHWESPGSNRSLVLCSRKMIVFGQPNVGEDEIQSVVETLRSGWIGTGPRVKEFQEQFADYVGGRFAIATSSCTAALHLCMTASGIGPGDEVITTPMTFCATANAILHTGARPVFVDCDRRTLNIRAEAIEEKITSRTRAIIPVHMHGRPCDMVRIGEIADHHGLVVIEDCAHAIEASVDGRHCGTFGNAGAFSFYVTKNITTVEGGMIITDDQKLAEKLRTLSLHGLSRDAWKRFGDEGYRHYTVSEPGYKYNMTDVQATMGICQLRKINEFHSRRQEIWRRYQDAFRDLPLILPADMDQGTRHALHLFAPLLDLDQVSITRDQLLDELHQRGVGSGVHYVALTEHPLYKTFTDPGEQFPDAEFISDRTFSIPFSSLLSNDDVDVVINSLRDVVGM